MTRHLKQSKANRAGAGSIPTKGQAALNKGQCILFVWLMALAGIWLLSLTLSE
jgi:hypothetical protein